MPNHEKPAEKLPRRRRLHKSKTIADRKPSTNAHCWAIGSFYPKKMAKWIESAVNKLYKKLAYKELKASEKQQKWPTIIRYRKRLKEMSLYVCIYILHQRYIYNYIYTYIYSSSRHILHGCQLPKILVSYKYIYIYIYIYICIYT